MYVLYSHCNLRPTRQPIKPANPHTKPTRMTILETGDKAPDFTLVNHEMKPTSLKDYKGHRVVLAFYPGAYTGAARRNSAPYATA